VGWKAIDNIASLIHLSRDKSIPIIYVAHDTIPKGSKGWIPKKISRKTSESLAKNADIVKEIAPVEGDIVIYKTRSSMLYGTYLLATLIGLGVDTLLICGTATGGCVRASVVDAHNNNFRVMVIEECTFDRAPLTHKVNLFEMNAKNCDVITMAEAKEYIGNL
ncbi:isochorismatase family protein, partial [Chloroflexota bacterium]